jgi:hypothetical protein
MIVQLNADCDSVNFEKSEKKKKKNIFQSFSCIFFFFNEIVFYLFYLRMISIEN